MRSYYLFAAMILTLSLGCGSGPPNSDVVCDPNGCISLNAFSNNLASALQGRVVGYVYGIGGESWSVGGQARTQADWPFEPMSPKLRSNIASVSKMITAIGVLQSLNRHGLTIDTKIARYLYPDWSRGQNIDTISFRDLLTHKSGFRDDCNHNRTTYAILRRQIENGVELADKEVASYNNCNFAIFRELLPFMEGHSIDGSDQARAAASATFYISYINQHVFRAIGVGTRECKPTSPDSQILTYPSPPAEQSGTDWGDWTLSCGGGGWVLSAEDIYKILEDLANGHILLSEKEKANMNSDCLGWDGSNCSVMANCPRPYNCKNGALVSGDIDLWTYAGIFKCSVPVVLIVNSFLPAPYQPYDHDGNPIGNKGNIIGLVRDAYKSAEIAGLPKPCQ
jgi:hypothetical protein